MSTDIFPEGLPWLNSDEKYLRGTEVGALLMLCQLGIPMIKLKCHGINEDQIRVGAAFIGYHVCVDSRDSDWTYLTLAAKAPMENHDDDE